MADEPRPHVVLRTSDGRTVTTTAHRYPELDRPAGHPNGEIRYWRVVPDEEVSLQTCEVREPDGRPPHTGFFLDLPQAGLETLKAEQ